MESTNKFNKRPLSLSSFQPHVELTEYINPERAHRALFAHHQRECRNNKRYEESYKTVMCQNWLERAQCSFGKNCRFAHGFDDLRTPTLPLPINEKYKTRICEKYTSRGICPYGSRCLFIHPDHPNTLQQNTLQINYIQNNCLNTSDYFAKSMPATLVKKRNKNLFPQVFEYFNVFCDIGFLIFIDIYFLPFNRFLKKSIVKKENKLHLSSDPIQLEMERIVDRLIASPLI